MRCNKKTLAVPELVVQIVRHLAFFGRTARVDCWAPASPSSVIHRWWHAAKCGPRRRMSRMGASPRVGFGKAPGGSGLQWLCEPGRRSPRGMRLPTVVSSAPCLAPMLPTVRNTIGKSCLGVHRPERASAGVAKGFQRIAQRWRGTAVPRSGIKDLDEYPDEQ